MAQKLRATTSKRQGGRIAVSAVLALVFVGCSRAPQKRTGITHKEPVALLHQHYYKHGHWVDGTDKPLPNEKEDITEVFYRGVRYRYRGDKFDFGTSENGNRVQIFERQGRIYQVAFERAIKLPNGLVERPTSYLSELADWRRARKDIGAPPDMKPAWLTFGQNSLLCVRSARGHDTELAGYLMMQGAFSESTGRPASERGAALTYAHMPDNGVSGDLDGLRSDLEYALAGARPYVR
jgi:hypothetical protein